MNHFLQGFSIITASLALLGVNACDRSSNPDGDDQQNALAGEEMPEPEMPDVRNANGYSGVTVELAPYATTLFTAAEGHDVSGNVQFMRLEGGNVRVIGNLANLPAGNHDLRILQSGDCRDISGIVSSRISEIESAVQDEGEAELPNGGIIGTLSVGGDNLASFDMYVDQLTLDGPGSIVGKAMIVDPQTGQDGIACGVITLNAVTGGVAGSAVDE